jgi:hypothetical protein
MKIIKLELLDNLKATNLLIQIIIHTSIIAIIIIHKTITLFYRKMLIFYRNKIHEIRENLMIKDV